MRLGVVSVYRRPRGSVPEPGDLITAFSPQPGRCFRMVYSVQLQATYCCEPPGVEGRLAGQDRAELVCGGLWGACAEAEGSALGRKAKGRSINAAADAGASSSRQPSPNLYWSNRAYVGRLLRYESRWWWDLT